MGLFGDFEVFQMDIAYCHGITTEVHDELAVAKDAHNVAFLTFQEASKHTQLDMVFGELNEGVAKERDTLGLLLHYPHERTHQAVGNGGGTTSTAIVDKIVLREVALEEIPQLQSLALQKDKPTDSGLLLLLNALAVRFLAVVGGAMDETLRLELTLRNNSFKPFLEFSSRHVLYKNIPPWSFLAFIFGHSSHFRIRFIISFDYVDALW